jgi:hypothetical protein
MIGVSLIGVVKQQDMVKKQIRRYGVNGASPQTL